MITGQQIGNAAAQGLGIGGGVQDRCHHESGALLGQLSQPLSSGSKLGEITPDMQAINIRVLAAMDEVSNLVCRAGQISDRLFGAPPSCANAKGEAEKPYGDVATIHASLDRLDMQISWMRDQIGRLERL